MHQKTKKKDKNGDVIIRAVVAGIVAAVILLLAYSLMIDKGVASIKYVGYAVIGINFIAAAVCGIVAGSAAGEGRLVRAGGTRARGRYSAVMNQTSTGITTKEPSVVSSVPFVVSR